MDLFFQVYRLIIDLPEIIELKNHPWFIGVQFHPEFKSRPFNPHPLFTSFIKAAKKDMQNKIVNCNGIEIANNKKITLIAGPCQLESEQHAMDMSGKIKEITSKLNIGFIYKTSFDKANRTSLKGKRGAGLENSLPVFDKIKKELNVPILTDVHNEKHCEVVSNHVDILQIPAFLCRQTDLLIAAAKTNKIINVKKGQFLAPWDMVNVTKKISDSGNDNILVTERGASFGYNTLVSDMRSIPIMIKNGYPVVFDATHSVQQPGGLGEKSGGQREFVEYLARAASAVGVAAIFMETHQDPDNAPSDGPNMVPLNKLESLLNQIIEIDKLVKNFLMSIITKVIARQVFDSRGNPTVEAEVFSKNISSSSICPSGASTGSFEAYEKRDLNKKIITVKVFLKL